MTEDEWVGRHARPPRIRWWEWVIYLTIAAALGVFGAWFYGFLEGVVSG